MHRITFSTTYLVLLHLLPVRAAFTDFFFAGNNGSSSALRTCPGSPFECIPPSVCSFDERTFKTYCCIPGSKDAVCWGPSEGCDGGDRTTPAGNQRSCGSGINAFCCLKSSEICTEALNQINICWSSLVNPLASLDATAVNKTAQSLISASPSAASYPVKLLDIEKPTSTTAALSSTTPSTPISTSTASLITVTTSTASSLENPVSSVNQSRSTSTPAENDSSGISGGAIGGIVGGVVGGLALLGFIGFFLWRRRKNSKRNPYQAADSFDGSPTYTNLQTVELNANREYAEAPVQEKYGGVIRPVAEAPADREVAELPASDMYNHPTH
ncbi:hypothetical protein COCMIDRAFT_6069 [Bipolaris oryzae ATCC 44560]|uniref:Mid2 domain-containing protein n=1 Tax=Bipolaris oryzae ATCC 44560 TaxID=930090 RepID=W6ZB01_COCMI|nr:uncharacterized protein COCMIDRAFT_6069 [Bipolaris oryzae ATCC 44560]EUC44649.1 hypothetical protein COCMIDRAFT_6069 [Bipolaris oryzae ATCC 44560]